jgi:hypothetical protein
MGYTWGVVELLVILLLICLMVGVAVGVPLGLLVAAVGFVRGWREVDSAEDGR